MNTMTTPILSKPRSACAFCPGYQTRRVGSTQYQSHRCRWFKTFGVSDDTTHCEGVVRYVSTEIWPIVQLRLP